MAKVLNLCLAPNVLTVSVFFFPSKEKSGVCRELCLKVDLTSPSKDSEIFHRL